MMCHLVDPMNDQIRQGIAASAPQGWVVNFGVKN